MRIATSSELVAPPDLVFATRATKEFQLAKCHASGAIDQKIDITSKGDHTVIHTTRTMPTHAFPDSVRSLVGPHLILHEQQDWAPASADGTQVAALSASIDGIPITLRGSVSVAPTESGSEQRLEAELKANVPLFGGKIERLAAPAIQAGFDIEALQLNDLLYE